MNSSLGVFLNSPGPLVAALFGVLLSSGVSLLLKVGSRDSGRPVTGAVRWISVWLPVVSTFGLLIVLVLSGRALPQGVAEVTKDWSLGWILPLRQADSIALGLRVDRLSISAGVVITVLVLLGQVFLGVERGAKNAAQLSSAMGIGLAGALICWIAINPWLSFVGMVFVALGGLIALGAEWRFENESDYLIRFGIERAGGLVLAVVGACVLPIIGFGNPKFGLGATVEHLFSGSVSEGLGVALFISGVLVFMQPFPLLGRVSRVVRNQPMGSVYLAQAMSAWAALGVLIRNIELIRSSGFQEGLGWSGLVCANLAVIAGLLQTSWVSAAALWVSCVVMVSVAALGFSGTAAAFSLGLGVPIAGLVWSILGHEVEIEERSAISSPKPGREKHGQSSSGIGAIAVTASWAGSGALFFLGAGGWLALLDRSLENSPARFAFLTGIALSSLVLVARVAWLISNSASGRGANAFSWARTAIPVLILVSGLGVIWNGTLTGFGAQELNDRVASSLLDLFPDGVLSSGSIGHGPVLIGLQLSLALLSFLFVLWGRGRSSVLWKTLAAKAPRTFDFLASGYRIDALMGVFVRSLKRVGLWLQSWVDQRVFGQWVPNALERGVEALGSRVGTLDRKMTEWIVRFARGFSMAFSAGVQSLQTGDLQWYITFAVGSGIALLLHFFANRP